MVAWREFCGVCLLLLTAACAGKPQGLMAPVSAPVSTDKVEMLVATTRMRTSPAEMFSGERGETLDFADITVSIPPAQSRAVGEVQWPKRLPANPMTDFVTVDARVISDREVKTRFRDLVGRHRPRRVLLFVHGYNNRFEEAVYRFAQIAHDSSAPAAPVLFTWPSRGRLLAYGYDRESANYSRDALEETLQALVDSPYVDEVAILAHSMGNWVTMEALRQMAIRHGRLSAKINTVMMASPDVDVDVFASQVRDLGSYRPQMILFVAQDDRALAMSKRLWGSRDRLGAINPDVEPYRSALERSGIQVLDLTKVETGDASHHAKFAESPVIVQAIGQRLVEGQDLGEGKASLGERITLAATGAASTLGATAGAIVSAPIAVVDPKTRQGLHGQIQEIGRSTHGISAAAK